MSGQAQFYTRQKTNIIQMHCLAYLILQDGKQNHRSKSHSYICLKPDLQLLLSARPLVLSE